ncbi:MAG: branched-chain amino acid ABC transporter substrate-binding protein [Anaerolineae bacterium]|nr:branched-chain amino acid ABC transporter substrate-binding protein [Anaerolineae bacterium]
MKKLSFLCTLILITSILLTGCGPSTSKVPTKGDVIVYVAVPLSGFQANGGQTVLGGVRLAAEEINRSGGLLGYNLVIRPLDDESDSEVAVAQIAQIQEALQRGEKVLGVIGHLNSGQTLAAMEYYKDMPIIIITPTASEQSLSQKGYDNFFRVNASDDIQAAIDAQFLVEKLAAQQVLVIHNDTEYGQGLATALIEELQKRGAEASARIEVAEGQGQYAEEIQQIQATNADAIFYAGYEIETPYLRYALDQAGINLPMLASDGAFLAATIDEAAGAAEGLYVSAFAPSPQNVADPKWFEAYQAVEYRNPDTYSINGYIAMQVMAEGVRKANSLDSNAIAETLRSNKISTLLNSFEYKPNGDLTSPTIWIYQVVNGEFEQVE